MPFPERGHSAYRPSLNHGENGIRTETVVKCQGAPHGREKTFWSWSWTTSPRSRRSSTFASRRGASASDPLRDAEEAERIAADLEPDIVVTDVVLHGCSGLDLIKALRATRPSLPVIFMTAHGSIDLAVEAIKAGAQDYLTKRLNYAQLEALLEVSRSDVRRRARARALDSRLEDDGRFGPWLRGGSRMREVFDLVKLVASNDTTTIITGESGTGKEVVARTIHALSNRCERPLSPSMPQLFLSR